MSFLEGYFYIGLLIATIDAIFDGGDIKRFFRYVVYVFLYPILVVKEIYDEIRKD